MPLFPDQTDQDRLERIEPQAREMLTGVVPDAEQGRFHLEQRHEDIYSFRHQETGRFLHMTPERHFYNQQAEPISQEAAVSHALGRSLSEQQEKTRDPREHGLGL